jgi:hypothetical protein
LQHNADLRRRLSSCHIAHVDAVDGDGAGRHVVEARQQVDQRRLARARRPDDGDGLPRLATRSIRLSTGSPGLYSAPRR